MQTSCSSLLPTILALCQLSYTACIVPIKGDNGEIVSQDLIKVVDKDVVIGGGKEDII
jgi:hypothetical protein